jgi:hypothetical protein
MDRQDTEICSSPRYVVVEVPIVRDSIDFNSIRRRARPLAFSECIRCGKTLTNCALVAVPIAILIGAFKVSIEDWAFAPLILLLGFLGAVLLVWVGTLIAGCLAMIPVGIMRLCERLNRTSVKERTSQGKLWDSRMDGPEPL